MVEISKIRTIMRHHQSYTDKNNQNCFYRVDNSDVMSYFIDSMSPWIQKIEKFEESLRLNNKVFTHVDICGSAKWHSADIYCSFAINPGKYKHLHRNLDANIYFKGDIFSSKSFNDFIQKIVSRSIRPSLVTFRPLAGLGGYYSLDTIDSKISRSINYGILGKRLIKIYAILEKGGYIFLERPFQMSGILDFAQNKSPKDYELSILLIELGKKLGYQLSIAQTIDSPYYLIRKPKRKCRNSKIKLL